MQMKAAAVGTLIPTTAVFISVTCTGGSVDWNSTYMVK